ncbi:hypothetical protein AGMMS49992_08320 [Clostridia bacterium]|nr:hypothetical protein AGMMS49992_08320 [Clostridia bacterium]
MKWTSKLMLILIVFLLGLACMSVVFIHMSNSARDIIKLDVFPSELLEVDRLFSNMTNLFVAMLLVILAMCTSLIMVIYSQEHGDPLPPLPRRCIYCGRNPSGDGNGFRFGVDSIVDTAEFDDEPPDEIKMKMETEV